jgi:flagellar biosynthesis protein FlhG
MNPTSSALLDLGVKPIQVLAVTSGKGGVGKTTISINLAIAMAKLGRRVMLLDADLGLANVDVMLGLRPAVNLSHVIDGVCDIDEIVLTGPAGIKIIPASSGIRRMADLTVAQHAGLVYAFSSLAGLCDILLIDTSAGISESVIRFCIAAQDVIIVVCNEPASVTDAYAMIKVLHQDYGLVRFRVLVNQTESAEEGRVLFENLVNVTQRFLNVSLDHMGTVPYDPNFRKCVQRQRALLEMAPRCPAAQAFDYLAVRADKWPVPSMANGKLEFFVERMITTEPMGRRVRV